MNVFLANNTLSLELAPTIGGSVSRFAFHDGKTIELFRKARGETVLEHSMFPMVPFCGRIRDNSFKVNGKTFYLEPNFGDEPIVCHGDGWLNAWQVEETSEDKAVLKLDWLEAEPYRYQAWQIFELLENKLVATLKVTNKAKETMPFGLGFHPYFERVNVKTLQMKNASVWLEGPLHLHTERVTTPPELAFDKTPLPHVWRNLCYSGWDGVARLEFDACILEIRADSQHVHLYTPPGEPYFCLEPQSHCTTAFNLEKTATFDPGTVFLQPDESLPFTVTFEVKATPSTPLS
jgi:aldose 1-epimerase